MSLRDDEDERGAAAHEAAVLEAVGGVHAPSLLDVRMESPWFDAPVLCLRFVDGSDLDPATVTVAELEALGAAIAAVHATPVEAPSGGLGAYVDERLLLHEAYLPRLHRTLPTDVLERVTGALHDQRRSRPDTGTDTATEAPLVLLHGDLGPGNLLWADGPVLIDWEYARPGDPADDLAYLFGQHDLTPDRRAAIWRGYGGDAALVGRAAWWEPVLLLGSALWWFERWTWRIGSEGGDPRVPKEPGYYLGEAMRRLARVDGST